MINYLQCSKKELEEKRTEFEKRYEEFKQRNLKLDMSRGKPASEQLDISNDNLKALNNYTTRGGIDARNYGLLDGIPEMKEYFSSLLGLNAGNIIIGGNSSLNLMYDQLVHLMLFGTHGSTPWCKQSGLKWLCPSPGYDRHFAITQKLGFEMIVIPMNSDGPDMDMVEELVAKDPSIKGIWCVPLYSNPQGICYSDEVVRRLGSMKCAAPDFRIFWDNAYGVHHILGEKRVADIFEACVSGGNPDRPYYFFSTSKITFPGAGVAIMAAGPTETKEVLGRLKYQTISYDKLNQLRLMQFLPTPEDLRNHMRKLAGAIKPKFELVQRIFSSEFEGSGLLSWEVPTGGYFYAVDTLDGCAKKTVEMAAAAGVKLTSAGATFPYGRDPRDRNIRIAPTYPPIEELELALRLFVICVKLVGTAKLLETK